VTPNDPNDADGGANNLQNYPVITTGVLSGGTLTINYSVPSSTSNSAYPLTVEFFRADADGQEGETFLDSVSYLAPGAAVAPVSAGGTVAGQRVLATATDANGNTSEFSASVAVASGLLAPSELARGEGGDSVRADDVLPVAWEAISVWQASGLDAAQVAALRSLEIEVADLPSRHLGPELPGRVVLEVDAAGYGWYVDTTPGTRDDTVPSDRRDLLTAILHEMGYAIGLVHADGEEDVMAEVLQPGTRRLPTTEVDAIFARGLWLV
jgi:hypothetical protein